MATEATAITANQTIHIRRWSRRSLAITPRASRPGTYRMLPV
jgi:hypothetical protein